MSTNSIYTLGELRTMAQQRADLVNSPFITNAEWNNYINESAYELYDLLVAAYGNDYYTSAPYTITTDGTNFLYALPTDFYKMVAVDVLLMGSNFYVPLKTFAIGDRTPNYYIGAVPANGQVVRLFYVQRLQEMVVDGDTLDGVSGWGEYVIVDTVIKALQKEETDVQSYMIQKEGLRQRIMSMAPNRDAANPITVTDSQAQAYGWPFAINSLYAPNILRYLVQGSKLWLINYGLGIGGGYGV